MSDDFVKIWKVWRRGKIEFNGLGVNGEWWTKKGCCVDFWLWSNLSDFWCVSRQYYPSTQLMLTMRKDKILKKAKACIHKSNTLQKLKLVLFLSTCMWSGELNTRNHQVRILYCFVRTFSHTLSTEIHIYWWTIRSMCCSGKYPITFSAAISKRSSPVFFASRSFCKGDQMCTSDSLISAPEPRKDICVWSILTALPNLARKTNQPANKQTNKQRIVENPCSPCVFDSQDLGVEIWTEFEREMILWNLIYPCSIHVLILTSCWSWTRGKKMNWEKLKESVHSDSESVWWRWKILAMIVTTLPAIMSILTILSCSPMHACKRGVQSSWSPLLTSAPCKPIRS